MSSALTVKTGDVLLLAGTTKGAFLLRAGALRNRFALSGPHYPGRTVYAIAYDDRAGRHRIWAGVSSMHWGASLVWSDDFGRSWHEPETPLVRFPEAAGASLRNIWQIQPGRADEPDVLYCGVEPAALFESRDGGRSFALVQGLWDHPHRPRWQPGNGGLCLHTVIADPERRERLMVAISTGGVYRSDDGGRTWATRHQGVRAQFLPDPHPEFGQCVHKVACHPSRPDRLFLQNHWGLYRSDDAGDSWVDVANGVPSDFGFALAVHPHEPETAFIVPLQSDEFRCVPEGKLRVYRTRDAGASWQPRELGLPQRDAFETVLRDALATEPSVPAGVYFGTRSGRVYGSADGGDTWRLVQELLPPVVCVRAAVMQNVGEARRPRVVRIPKAARRSA
jgi:photosystem II stability/assembly factor-like uncharacterized protein